MASVQYGALVQTICRPLAAARLFSGWGLHCCRGSQRLWGLRCWQGFAAALGFAGMHAAMQTKPATQRHAPESGQGYGLARGLWLRSKGRAPTIATASFSTLSPKTLM